MMPKSSEVVREQVTIAIAAQRTGLSVERVRYCIRHKLVAEALTERELARLRRIRRLGDLGINLAGIEVILNMRRRITDLQERIAQLEASVADKEVH
jgi:MerR family transcriptional regulator/heat shock protein HspR